jgi:type II secretory pathway predicted ATPase ExeA
MYTFTACQATEWLKMYESYWELQRAPFETGCDERFYYAGSTHRVSLAKLQWAVQRRHGAVLLSGGFGMGKTMLAELLGSQCDRDVEPVLHVVFPPLTAPPLLAYLAEELEATLDDEQRCETDSVHKTIRYLTELLTDNARNGKHALVIVDEAQLLQDAATLEALRMLTNLHCEGRPVLTLLLVGQPSLLSTVGRMPQLEGRLAAKCVLRPFSLDESAAYVEHRLQAAGATRPIFEAEALRSVHALTGGVPRLINRLCELVLLVGCSQQTRSIQPEQVENVGLEINPSLAAS